VVAKPKADKLLMLLSAEWFAPYCKSFGLVLTGDEQARVQRVARDGVRNFIGSNDTYWNIDLSQQRVAQTVDSFSKGLRDNGLSTTAVAQILDLFTEKQTDVEAAATMLWLLSALSDQLISSNSTESRPEVAAETLQVVQSMWQASVRDATSEELERSALASQSEWDRYLRCLTPDLPTYLSDWAAQNLKNADRFQRFWAQLFWVTSATDRQILRDWYQAEARKLADPSFSPILPQWMRADWLATAGGRSCKRTSLPSTPPRSAITKRACR
jgi:hypothetical protein